MNRVKSIAKIIIALLMALALTTLTACDVLDDFFGKGEGGGGTGDGNTYQVTLEKDGGNFTDLVTEYTSGTACTLPTDGTKAHYTFDGWYENSNLSGTKVTKIPAGATGDKTYYAKWNPETYNVTLTIKDDSSYQSPVSSYTYGIKQDLPQPEKNGSTFNGWYTKSDLSGNKVTEIASGEYGNKTFYGAWVSQGTSVTKFTVTLHDNGGTYKGNEITEYIEGIGAVLPQMEKANCDFGGWYDNKACTGNSVSAITENDTGDKEYWAKFTPISADALQFTAYGGYEEGAYVEFDLDSSVSLDKVTVSYKSNSGPTVELTGNDKTYLVRRIADNKVRADIVGITNGTCQITVNANGKTANKTVTVDSYDRSGYAHFNYTNGVGAYKDDGTLKNNAVTVYVDEEHKNSVSAKINGSTKTGLKNILAAATSSSSALVVRIVGRISAPTWAHSGDQPMIKYTKADKKLTFEEAQAQTKAKFGVELSNTSYTQDTLVGLKDSSNEKVFKLEEGIAALNGLTSTMKLGSDCRWNDMSIGGSSNKPTNITVEGIGTDAEIFQWGFTWNYANSVEIRNITFDDYTEDACSFQGNTDAGSAVASFGSSRIWVHNCTFNEGKNYWDTSDDQDKGEGDGATDFKSVSNVTVSYNKYYNNHKTGLVGSSSDSYTSNVTFHHNLYDQCKSRLPMGRQANIHMYNNYYKGTTDYCLSARNNMYAFIEACYFENCNDTIRTESDAVVKLFGCKFVGCNYKTSYAITNAATREQIVANNNFMIPSTVTDKTNYCLDNDSTMFYLNSDGTTKATLLTSADQAKTDCLNLSGVHKNK